MLRFCSRALKGLLFVVFMALSSGWAESTIEDTVVEAILSTPVSSRINQVGYKVKAVSLKPLSFNDGQTLPSGTTLYGHISAVESSKDTRSSGRLKLLFTQAIISPSEHKDICLIPDTPDGWLNKADTYLGAVKEMPGHSTRLLNAIIRRRLPADRAVWGQLLGLNINNIPDPSTDEFMQEYNRHDVLLGAGDWLRLRPASLKELRN